MKELKSLIGWVVLIVFLILIFRSRKKKDAFTPPVKWAIFTQVHKPPQFSKWLEWHQSLHPDKIWIVVENDPNLMITPSPNIVVKYTENLNGGSWGSQLDDRKTANFNEAAEKLREEGIEWMIIVDDDEFIYGGPIAQILGKYPNDDCLVIKNYEAVFKDINENGQCFSPSARFVDCQKGKCLGYSNGKSWGRISNPNIKQLGAHRQTGSKQCKNKYLPDSEMCMLHFESCNFDKWKNKFSQIGKELENTINFAEFKGNQEGFFKKFFPYYYKSAMEIKDIQDPQQLKEFYRKHKVEPWSSAQTKKFDL